ncbi:hypothetical protein AB0M47_03365 [Hamadaea sp. NPDC051192]|uniref:hypothetical protein n=1 Tax=Hamadaea sp. NPDC051192 TaxID=3154940 RepID=UPI003423C5F1
MSAGALMPRARQAADDATADVGSVLARISGSDPVDYLVERSRAVAVRAVDPLQIAAWLETDGVTDRVARVEFGYADVFALAEEVFRRAGPPPPVDRPAPPALVRGARDLGHGALYLLPTAIFPAVLTMLGASALLRGVLLVGWVSWVLSGSAAWLGYHLVGVGRPESAGRILRWSTLASLPVSGLLGALVVGRNGGAIILAVGLTAYQMSVTTLVFYRHEQWIFAAMAPAALAGILCLTVGPRLLGPAVVLAMTAVAFTLGAALHATTHPEARPEPPLWPMIRMNLRRLSLVVAFTALTAAYFLYPQAYLLSGDLVIALGALPVVAGMGIVEWQAHRFGDRAHALLAEVGRPDRFAARANRLMLIGLGTCLAGVGLLAAGLVAALAVAGKVSPPVLAMSAASVLLAGAYFVTFLLANLGRQAWLCVSLLGCLVAFTAAAGSASAARAAEVFAATTALLLLLTLVAAYRRIGQVWGHR